jgi:hypothetical protein
MLLATQRVRAANGPRLIKATIALGVAEACLCLLLFLLSPVQGEAQGSVSETGPRSCPVSHDVVARLPVIPVSLSD